MASPEQDGENKEVKSEKEHLEIGFFRATVESVLLYGAESWTLTGKMSDRLDGTYTKMPRAVL